MLAVMSGMASGSTTVDLSTRDLYFESRTTIRADKRRMAAGKHRKRLRWVRSEVPQAPEDMHVRHVRTNGDRPSDHEPGPTPGGPLHLIPVPLATCCFVSPIRDGGM
jgi:hypothetical protein